MLNYATVNIKLYIKDILLADNVMKDMDLYDMAFVIDYLRDWAIKLNRIAVMAIQPPTFEILTMFRKGK